MSCSLLTVLGSASGTCQTWVLHKQSPCLTRLVTDPNTFKRLQLTAKQTIEQNERRRVAQATVYCSCWLRRDCFMSTQAVQKSTWNPA